MKQNKIVLGVCGGSGSGKTHICEILSSLGAYIIDGDKIARLIMEKGSPALLKVRELLGDKYITERGDLNRPLLSADVFKNPEKLKILNSITHPLILSYIKKEIENSEDKIVVLDGALVHKAPFCDLCTHILFVKSDFKERVERIMERDGISRERATERISAQSSDGEYEAACDFVISGTLLSEQQKELLQKILSDIGR